MNVVRNKTAIGLILVPLFALVATSRGISNSIKDDVQTYFDHYNFTGLEGVSFSWASEVFLPFVHKLIYSVLGDVSIHLYTWVNCVIVVSLIYIGVSRFTKDNVAVVFTFLLLPFFAPTIYLRQVYSIALCFVLIAYHARTYAYIMPVLFHHAVVTNIVFASVKIRSLLLYFIIAALIVVLLFIDQVLFKDFPKIRAWLVFKSEFEFMVFFNSYKLLFAGLFLSFIFKKQKVFKLQSVILILGLALDLFIPYISQRIFLAAFIFSGLILFHSISNSLFGNMTKVLVFLILLCFKFFPPLLKTPSEYFEIGNDYPLYGAPFYYIYEVEAKTNQRERKNAY